MKKILFCLCGLVFLAGIVWGLNVERVQETVKQNYGNKNGLIKNYGCTQDTLILSESIGQYLEYLLLTKDETSFHEQTQLLENYYLVTEKDATFIKWQLGDQIFTNASVDDLRIIKTLKEAGQVFQQIEYKVLAKKLEKSLLTHQLKDGMLTDFYDWYYQQNSSFIHLSYIDFDAFKGIPEIDQDAYIRMLEQSVPEDSPFFQEIWDTEDKTYEEANKKEVDLIDQLLIAIQYAKGVEEIPESFDNWIKKEWQIESKLYGRYQKDGEIPSVSYESSAVYALTVQYFWVTGQNDLADIIAKKLVDQPPFTTKDSFSSVHFFDYILAHMTAERFEQ